MSVVREREVEEYDEEYDDDSDEEDDDEVVVEVDEEAALAILSKHVADPPSLLSLLVCGPPQGWRQLGSCFGAPSLTTSFYPERGETVRQAKMVCAGCLVRTACLADACIVGEKHGIWGGTSERERRQIRRALKSVGVRFVDRNAPPPITRKRRVSRSRARAVEKPSREQLDSEPGWRRLRVDVDKLEVSHRVRRRDGEAPYVPEQLFSPFQRQAVTGAVAGLQRAGRVQVLASRVDSDRIAVGTVAVLETHRVLMVVPSMAGIDMRLAHWSKVGWSSNVAVVARGASDSGLPEGIRVATAKRLKVAAGGGEMLVISALKDLGVVESALRAGMADFDMVVVEDLGWMLVEDADVGARLEALDARNRLFFVSTDQDAQPAGFGDLVCVRTRRRVS